MKKNLIAAVFAAIFFLLPSFRCFAGGSKEPRLVVSTVDGESRLISIDWTGVSKPENYQWGLYRFDLEEKLYTLISRLEAFESSYTDESPDPPLSKYYYSVERASKNASLDALTPRRVNKDDIQEQLNSLYTVPDSSISSSPADQLSFAKPRAVSSAKPQTASYFFNEGIYIGIISFSGKVNDITQNPDGSPALVLVDSTGRQALIENLNRAYLPSKTNGTALYYASHKALVNLADMKNKNRLPYNVDSVTVITFTDGLDTSSTDANFSPLEGKNFSNTTQYRSFIKQQFSGNVIARKIPGVKKFNAWSIGIPGKDIQNQGEFTETLQSVASAPEYAEEVYEFSQVNAKLMNIADELLMLYRPRINLTVSTPAYPVGTLLRITFDAYIDRPDISEQYVDFRVSWDAAEKTYVLNLADARGMEITDDQRRIYGKRNETGIDYTMMFSADFNESNVRQWYMQPGEETFGWVQNSEFMTKKTADFTQEIKSEIIYFVLDSSSSLTEKEINEIRQAVTLFINKLYNSLYVTHSGDSSIAFSDINYQRNLPLQTDGTVSSVQIYRQTAAQKPPDVSRQSPVASSTTQVYQRYEEAGATRNPPPVSQPPLQTWQRTNSEFQFPPPELYQKPAVQAPPRRSAGDRTVNSAGVSQYTPPKVSIEIYAKNGVKTVSPQNRFWVQIGSFSDAAYAQRSWRTFSSAGMGSAEIFTSNVNGTLHYRVKAGPYFDKTEAENALIRLKNYSAEYKDCFVTSE
ncbi:MAG: SPOR domain-containing protein [Spirochaetaceae bacterium]|jgi:cell division protein FtsN|nr:SPOR domain-containing protein [Spirochaetaceae bacterium]